MALLNAIVSCSDTSRPTLEYQPAIRVSSPILARSVLIESEEMPRSYRRSPISLGLKIERDLPSMERAGRLRSSLLHFSLGTSSCISHSITASESRGRMVGPNFKVWTENVCGFFVYEI